jgi:2',3'-cyclic-nucleotide 2'-phosphodiesterase (5'-nucleotidase family)
MWQRPRLLGGLTFLQSLEALRGVLAEARKIKPDVLVLAVHQGWRQWGDDRANEINQIAKTFPDFDLIIGAHTHQAVEAREVNRIIYTQAGDHGMWLGKVSLSYDDQRRKLTKIEPRLIAICENISPDPELKKMAAGSISTARAYLSRKIGENRRELTAEPGKNGQSGIQTLICAAMAGSVNADVVLHGALSKANLRVGEVRMADLWRIVPYENTIGKARLTLDEIREILEENSRYYGKNQFRGVYGLSYDFSPNAPPGERVSNLRLDSGRALKKDERITFAVNSYDLASAGGRFPRLREIMERRAAGLEETEKDTRESVIEFIEEHSPLDMETAPGAKIVIKRDRGK